MQNWYLDADFTIGTKEFFRYTVRLFWSKILFVPSVNDKARVPIGITVANK